jgi:hypothetical protein
VVEENQAGRPFRLMKFLDIDAGPGKLMGSLQALFCLAGIRPQLLHALHGIGSARY